MRILITIEYNGKCFSGWQIQPEKRTVQGELTTALSDLLGEKITLHGSGRTDAGVHALNQKAHFDFHGDFPIDRLPLAINTKLPDDVSVKEAVIVPDNFEAQYSAKKKTYRYNFYFSKISRPLINGQSAMVTYPKTKFDIDKARKALSLLVGTHDFVAFSSTGRTVSNSIRTIYEANLLEFENGEFSVTVTGNGFLYNMVRIIVGTVVEIGISARPISDIEKALETGKRAFCGKTFPAHGLTLVSVSYDND